MTGPILGLTLAYVAVAALLLCLNLATRFAPWVKGTAVVLVTMLYASAWFGYRGLLGWASPAPLPETFRVLWITAEEPDKGSGAPGTIFFWVRELDEAGFPVGAPRAHWIPWDEASARAAQEALEKLEEGERLNGRLSRGMVDEGEGRPEEATGYAVEQSVTGAGGRRPDFEFVQVPPPPLPPKSVPDGLPNAVPDV
ncbi:MAG: hypothetical protein GWM88_14595 [Pseudomonadales bacterium]|nr:hypothetical protein [Pseudomonadales bacterium]NIX09168.1 hypothetical protein [Pseudomonadales bacterium]